MHLIHVNLSFLLSGSGNECKSDESLSVTVVVLIGVLAAVVLVAVIVQTMVIVFFMRKLRRERSKLHYRCVATDYEMCLFQILEIWALNSPPGKTLLLTMIMP